MEGRGGRVRVVKGRVQGCVCGERVGRRREESWCCVCVCVWEEVEGRGGVRLCSCVEGFVVEVRVVWEGSGLCGEREEGEEEGSGLC